MSQRGRGSGPRHDEHEGDETGRERGAGGYPLPPAASRPIVPYDPYRSRGSEPRSPGRGAGVQGTPGPYPRRDLGREDPFLPDDDPLNAEAWQLELSEGSADEDGATLPSIKLGQSVQVRIDQGEKRYKSYPGQITWISGKSEFTPKTIQTKNERANLVYAIKVRVKNDGYLKIGMYGEMAIK